MNVGHSLRSFDICFAVIGLVLGAPLLAGLCLVSWLDTRAAPIIIQQRLGRDQRKFGLLKFRTLSAGAPLWPAEFVPSNHVSRIGRIMRAAKLDELPQLWNILVGDMSFVGPRPSLLSYELLIDERAKREVYRVRPGLTGAGQVCGVTMARPILLARLDARLVQSMGLRSYFKYIALTLAGHGFGDALGQRAGGLALTREQQPARMPVSIISRKKTAAL